MEETLGLACNGNIRQGQIHEWFKQVTNTLTRSIPPDRHLRGNAIDKGSDEIQGGGSLEQDSLDINLLCDHLAVQQGCPSNHLIIVKDLRWNGPNVQHNFGGAKGTGQGVSYS